MTLLIYKHVHIFCSCKGLILLETYTTKVGEDLKLPDFLEVEKEVTDDPSYSMFNLSLKDIDQFKRQHYDSWCEDDGQEL